MSGITTSPYNANAAAILDGTRRLEKRKLLESGAKHNGNLGLEAAQKANERYLTGNLPATGSPKLELVG